MTSTDCIGRRWWWRNELKYLNITKAAAATRPKSSRASMLTLQRATLQREREREPVPSLSRAQIMINCVMLNFKLRFNFIFSDSLYGKWEIASRSPLTCPFPFCTEWEIAQLHTSSSSSIRWSRNVLNWKLFWSWTKKKISYWTRTCDGFRLSLINLHFLVSRAKKTDYSALAR